MEGPGLDVLRLPARGARVKIQTKSSAYSMQVKSIKKGGWLRCFLALVTVV